MANAVEDALRRASESKGFQEAVDSLKRNGVSIAENTDYSGGLASKQLDANTQANIETIQQGPGNNYLYQNAVERAQARWSQEPQKAGPEPGQGTLVIFSNNTAK